VGRLGHRVCDREEGVLLVCGNNVRVKGGYMDCGGECTDDDGGSDFSSSLTSMMKSTSSCEVCQSV
jgi:hypothetical protein